MVVASLFDKHPIAFALVCALVAVGFGIGFTVWLLGRPAGSERMQEISRAVQEGAAAYLRRQYTTIAAVSIVPFLLLGLYHKLGWGTAVGFLIGAPRTPAVIADNVGDNVGDCAGMAADLFETYAVTAVAVMLLGITTLRSVDLALYPLVLGGISILASVIGTFFARVGRRGSIMNALYLAVLVATVLSALGFIPVTMAFDNRHGLGFGDLYGSAIVGLVVTFLLVAITEFYTGTRWRPGKSISRSSQTGHATNIIEGLAVGMQATAVPVIVIAAGILLAHHFAGLYGIGVAVMAQLSMTGLIVALDAYGPVTDNA